MVILPRHPPKALAGQVMWITTSPRAVRVSDLADITTAGERRWAVGPVVPGVAGVGEGIERLVVAYALAPPLRLTVWPVKIRVVDVPAESVSVSVAV